MRTRNDIVGKLEALDYLASFRAAFPQESQPLSADNHARAIAAYEGTLVTPAPFDRFVAGDDRALDERQKAGLKSFVSVGCASCHSGATFGGLITQKFGLVKDYWLETGAEKPDLGRESITRREEDRFAFRVPSLRNVAKTAPYFHDGSVAQLERAVRVMASVQLGRALDDGTLGDIVAFLDSLTGEVPANYAPPGERPDI